MEIRNRVKWLYQQRKPAFGIQIKLMTTTTVDVAGAVGLDYIRVDAYKYHTNPAEIASMVRTVYGYDSTPWVRCDLNFREIMLALDVGAQVISCKVTDARDARAAVAAVRCPPAGERETSRPWRFHDTPDDEYLRWAAEQIVLCVQLESRGAWENYRGIVKVPGIDIIEFGKHGISQALGIPIELSGYGPKMDPRLEEAQRAVIRAAQDAGKQCAQMDSLTPWGFERSLRLVEQGVYVIGIDSDANVLHREYGKALRRLRGS